MAKNVWGKTRKESNPYATIQYGDWTWKILKAYQSRKNEIGNLHARYFCKVITPMTGEWGDLGDVYCHQVPMTREFHAILKERAAAEEKTDDRN